MASLYPTPDRSNRSVRTDKPALTVELRFGSADVWTGAADDRSVGSVGSVVARFHDRVDHCPRADWTDDSPTSR